MTGFAALVLVSCDSKQENMRENQLEKKADAMEDKADVTRENAEKVADKIEDKADAIRANDPGLNSKVTEAVADTTDAAADATREKK